MGGRTGKEKNNKAQTVDGSVKIFRLNRNSNVQGNTVGVLTLLTEIKGMMHILLLSQ